MKNCIQTYWSAVINGVTSRYSLLEYINVYCVCIWTLNIDSFPTHIFFEYVFFAFLVYIRVEYAYTM